MKNEEEKLLITSKISRKMTKTNIRYDFLLSQSEISTLSTMVAEYIAVDGGLHEPFSPQVIGLVDGSIPFCTKIWMMRAVENICSPTPKFFQSFLTQYDEFVFMSLRIEDNFLTNLLIKNLDTLRRYSGISEDIFNDIVKKIRDGKISLSNIIPQKYLDEHKLYFAKKENITLDLDHLKV